MFITKIFYEFNLVFTNTPTLHTKYKHSIKTSVILKPKISICYNGAVWMICVITYHQESGFTSIPVDHPSSPAKHQP